MKNKYVFTAVMLAVILFAGVLATGAYLRTEERQSAKDADDLLVVTSFYPMYIAAENIIGDTEGVALENLSEPQTGCLHDYQLTAEDMKLLSQADVFIVNGGGIESFLSDVAESYPDLTIIQACDGISLLEEGEDGHAHSHAEDIEKETDPNDGNGSEEHSHAEETDPDDGNESEEHSHADAETEAADSDTDTSDDAGHAKTAAHSHDEIQDGNAHAWMSLADYRLQLQNICSGLKMADPQHAEDYEDNVSVYDAKVQELEAEAEALKEQAAGQPVVIFHEAYAYVAEELGLSVVGEMDLDEERQISAGEVADILTAIEEHQVSVVLAEELYGSDMGDMVSSQSDAKVIYLDTLTRGDYSADSYLTGMRANLEQLKEALE